MNLVTLCHLFNHTNETEPLQSDANHSAFYLNKGQSKKPHKPPHYFCTTHPATGIPFFLEGTQLFWL